MVQARHWESASYYIRGRKYLRFARTIFFRNQQLVGETAFRAWLLLFYTAHRLPIFPLEFKNWLSEFLASDYCAGFCEGRTIKGNNQLKAE